MANKLLDAFRHFSWRLLGLNSLKQEVETLQFFLNYLHQPSEIQQTTDPDLRIVQECDILLLAIVSKVLNKHNLNYWLDYGTLLGCVRHNGFIPWDDDMDISMTREDYCVAKVIMKEELEPLGFTIEYGRQIGVGYQHSKTGIWLDIFANDSYYTNERLSDIRGNLVKKICKCGKVCRNHSNDDKDETWKATQRKTIIGGVNSENCSSVLLYLSPEFSYPYSHFIFDKNWVFPLKTTKIDGFEFTIPNNIPLYLKELYGNNYHNFPKTGVLHHDFGRGQLSTWAKQNGVNMNEVKAHLLMILNNL